MNKAIYLLASYFPVEDFENKIKRAPTVGKSINDDNSNDEQDELYDDAVSELSEIKERMTLEYEVPPLDMIG